jgi:hypothetical protein
LSAVLDAGALIAIDRRDRTVGAMLRVLHRDRVPILTSAGVVAQVWRDGARQANLARVLQGVDITALDDAAAKHVGELLEASRTADVVDAHVALLAHPKDRIITSDETDIVALLRTRRMKATVIQV